MAGIYIHIPFCKQACHYCDFHFSTSLKQSESLLDCIKMELKQRAAFGDQREIKTIYFGGGTPSLLSSEEINAILETVRTNYKVFNNAEITLEGNPDDLHKDYLQSLKDHTAVNRLSIGIQSFDEQDLTFMNRAHDPKQAHACLQDVFDMGFSNITADLIFGSETTTDKIWAENLKVMKDYNLPHLSIYGLSIEQGTALHHFIKSGKARPLDDEKFFRHFEMAQEYLSANGYEQYEVSNYSMNGFRSQHNGNYWNQVPYLGIGPSAHSFDNGCRYWNVSNNAKYIQGIKAGTPFLSMEDLSEKDLYNELLLTRMRCIDGVSKNNIQNLEKKFRFHFEAMAEVLLLSGQLKTSTDRFYIPKEHRIFTDQITQELFYTDD